MGKIGILTLHFSKNFGAVLQCTALIRALNSLGQEAVVIDYYHESARQYWAVWKSPVQAMKTQYFAYNGNWLRRMLSTVKCGAKTLGENRHYFDRARKDKAFHYFISANWQMSKRYFSIDELQADPPGCEGYITGSDQVWNSQATKGKLDDGYLLNFDTADKKRMSYGASIGFTPDDSFIEELIEKTQHFDAVSVREKSVWNHIEKLCPGYSTLVLDPTLLHKSDFWKEYEEKIEGVKQPYALLYRLSHNKEFDLVVNRIKRERKLKIIDISPPEVKILGCDNYENFCSPGAFLWAVHHCTLFVTDSFHGTVFSIIYKKEFYSLLRSGMESRVKDLLDVCKLYSRLIEKAEQIPKAQMECSFQECDKYLEESRKTSYAFLGRINK